MFKPAVADAMPERLDGRRWHDLRHTVALAIASGADAKEVSPRFGHPSVTMTFDRYGPRHAWAPTIESPSGSTARSGRPMSASH